jgi:hypothetical protein
MSAVAFLLGVGVSVLLMTLLADLRTAPGMRRFERAWRLASRPAAAPRVTDILVTAPKTSPPRA